MDFKKTRRRKLLEDNGPIILTAISFALFYFTIYKTTRHDDILNSIEEKALVVSGTLIGFLLTIYTLLGSIKTRAMIFIKTAGMMPRLQKFLKKAISWHLVVLSLILFVPVLDFAFWRFGATRLLEGFFIFSVLFSWFLSIRFVRIFFLVIGSPEEE